MNYALLIIQEDKLPVFHYEGKILINNLFKKIMIVMKLI